MVTVKVDSLTLCNFVFFCLALSLFCYGFFPLSFSPATKASYDDLPQTVNNISIDAKSYKPKVSRLILLIVDALRVDFVSHFPFLNKLIDDGVACQYQLKVHPPTVTMPRIKAMTSGAIPSFLDVILNLGSPEMTLDTFLYQMKQRQQRIVFYGDSTWTAMFPELFHRSGENVDSLYVNDFYEGDKNITRAMKQELQNYEWKLMILHYLGLDHIGHVEGPFSDKVPGKLKEMDTVIREIYLAIEKWNQKYYSKPMLLITGDHGMRDSGGHGGSTYAETVVPLIAVGGDCTKSDVTFLQIDVAPTVAVMMGVPIPHASIGSTIGPMLSGLDPQDRLFVTYYNTKRLMEKVNEYYNEAFESTEFYRQYKEAKDSHQKYLQDETDSSSYKKALLQYGALSGKLTELLISSYIRYDMLCIVLGIFLTAVSAFLAVLLLAVASSGVKTVSLRPRLLTWVSFSISGPLLQKFLQNALQVESKLMSSTCTFFAFYLLAYTSFYLQLVAATQLLKTCPSIVSMVSSSIRKSRLQTFILFGAVFHTVSLASSSFIEEEHQTWYFMGCSLLVLLTVGELKIMNQTIAEINLPTQVNVALIDTCKSERNDFCFGAIAFFGIHAALRKWNQTGDKWQHLPDIGDWLGMDDHKQWLSLIMVIGLCLLLYAVARFGGLLVNVLSLTACMLIYYYRCMTGTVSLFGRAPTLNDLCLTMFWVNLLEIFFIAFLPKIYRLAFGQNQTPYGSQMLDNSIIIVALLSALIHKPHNVILVGALMASSHYLTDRVDRLAESDHSKLLLKIIGHVWLGKMFYFYQGNSNNLATIDLNAGYVGLSSFSFVRVGLFLTLNTFNGQILSFLMLMWHLSNSKHRKSKDDSKIINDLPDIRRMGIVLLSVTTILPMSFFLVIVTLLRHHIFVWTVFSPKIIYDCFYVGLVLIKMLLVLTVLR